MKSSVLQEGKERRLRQEDCLELETSLGNIARLCYTAIAQGKMRIMNVGTAWVVCL